MERIHIYLDAQYIGMMTCPQCGLRRAINIPQQCPQVLDIVGEKIATITCRCGAVFESCFDLRRHPRRVVQFRGELVDPQACATLSDIVIVSLSVHGLGFVLDTPRNLHIGDVAMVRFCLDDVEQSRIHDRIIIRRLQGRMVGAEFYPLDQYIYALDFYVYGAQLLPPPRPVFRRTPRPPEATPSARAARSSQSRAAV